MCLYHWDSQTINHDMDFRSYHLATPLNFDQKCTHQAPGPFADIRPQRTCRYFQMELWPLMMQGNHKNCNPSEDSADTVNPLQSPLPNRLCKKPVTVMQVLRLKRITEQSDDKTMTVTHIWIDGVCVYLLQCVRLVFLFLLTIKRRIAKFIWR